MKYSPERVVDMICDAPWRESEPIRVFWVQLTGEGRADFAARMTSVSCHPPVVPIVIREPLFLTANALLSDFNRLLEGNKGHFDNLAGSGNSRLSIAILSRERLRLPQVSSPITLPNWFPVRGGRETFLRISDFGQRAEVGLLNCPEARVEDLSQQLFHLETALVARIAEVYSESSNRLSPCVALLFPPPETLTVETAVVGFERHLGGVGDPRGYRATGAKGPSIVSRLIRVVTRSSPDGLCSACKTLAKALDHEGDRRLRPTMFGVMLRPPPPNSPTTLAWHTIVLSVYQAYQLMNGAAHAGEYASYPIDLIYATALDVRRGLLESTIYLENVTSACG